MKKSTKKKRERRRILGLALTLMMMCIVMLPVTVMAMSVNIYVQNTGESFYIDVERDASIYELKERIQDFGIVYAPADQIQLYYEGQLLDDGQTLSDYRINSDATIELVISSYEVYLGDGLFGENTAYYGTDYTGRIENYSTSYDYTVEYTVAGGSTHNATIIDSGNGEFVIPGAEITGELSIMLTAVSKYESVTPNSDGVYEISNARQLFWFAALVNGDTAQEGIAAAVPDANAILTADIDLEDKDWTPIGDYGSSTSLYYSGTFDGVGHTIKGLYINSSNNYQGLFGFVSGTIQNVTVSGSVTGGAYYVGGVVGYNNAGTVTNCGSSGKVSGNEQVGGVVGYNNAGTVTNCYSSASVSGSNYVGGVAGYNSGTVTNCINSGEVSGSNYIGGAVGYNWSNGAVISCGNSGDVSGSSMVGGVVGRNLSTLNDSYNIGTVNSTDDTAGGVVGHNYDSSWTTGTVKNCYYLEGTAAAAIGSDTGTITNVDSKTLDEFESGEVTYLLTGGVTDGTQAWYQTLGTDNYPVLDSTHGTVYGTKCDGSTMDYYSNSVIHVGGSYDDGFCTRCDNGYEPATLNDEGVYEISNAGQLFWFASLVSGDVTQDGITAADTAANAVLTTSIDLGKTTDTHTDTEWTPIGTKAASYTGTFDGNGYTISGLSITAEAEYVGLFGYVENGTVKDLTVSGAIDVSGDTIFAGGIVGTIRNGVLSNLTSKVDVTGTTETKGTFGSLAATVEGTDKTAGSTMENCASYGDVTASGVLDCTGGLIGYMNSATINNCANYGAVDTTGATAQQNAGVNTGGIVGYINNKTAYITNCVNIGKVSNASSTDDMTCYTGAIVGRIRADLGGISNTYYLGTSASAGCHVNENGAELGITAKTADELASGEVAYILQGANTDMTWGQNLTGNTPDAYPIITDDDTKEVVKISFYKAGETDVFEARYTNLGKTLTSYPTGSYGYFTDSGLTSRINTSTFAFNGDTSVYMAELYSVTQNMTNVTSDNSATDVISGGTYTAKLTAADGYVIESVTVKMNGTDITSTAYSNGGVSISNVSGNIVISATAAKKEIKINGVVKNNNSVDVDITNTLGTSGIVIAVTYDSNGVMLDMATTDLPTASGTVNIGIGTSSADTVSVFIWNDLITMTPLCDAYTQK